MRLIDADNIIKTIRSNVRYDDNDTIKKIFDKFISIIQSEPTVNQWISVEDELPKVLEDGFSESVLITTSCDMLLLPNHIKLTVGFYDMEKGKWIGEIYELEEFESVIAWQPLPKPYDSNDRKEVNK